MDLYIILLRFSSLVSETIPFHRDYQVLLPKERSSYRKKLLAVIDELESLKPKFQSLNKHYVDAQQYHNDGLKSSLSVSEADNRVFQSSCNLTNGPQTILSKPMQIDTRFQQLYLSRPLPKKETLSRHSFLGPNGLGGQWQGPRAEIKVQYPSNTDLISTETSCINRDGLYGLVTEEEGNSGGDTSSMESVLSLDDGRWQSPAEDSAPLHNEARNDNLQTGIARQPSPPPILAQLQPDFLPISPSKVADPRPGPAKPSQNGLPNTNTFQQLHVPVKMLDDFLRLARENTSKNLETCGVLAGSLKNRVFHITTLIIPKQESTSDSCQTLNEEEIFEVQDKRSLFPLGWIHTHPSQTCFMSSVDLHTHYSYQIMLPEAIAIVMAPTDTSSPHGIFHLSDPGGVGIIRNCQQRGFHPHEEPSDGSPIYEHCSHVYMNGNLRFDVVDLR